MEILHIIVCRACVFDRGCNYSKHGKWQHTCQNLQDAPGFKIKNEKGLL
jgi:hypothetical protein